MFGWHISPRRARGPFLCLSVCYHVICHHAQGDNKSAISICSAPHWLDFKLAIFVKVLHSRLTAWKPTEKAICKWTQAYLDRVRSLCVSWRHKKLQQRARINSRMLYTTVASPCQALRELSGRPRGNAETQPRAHQFCGIVHAQFAEGLHFSAFHCLVAFRFPVADRHQFEASRELEDQCQQAKGDGQKKLHSPMFSGSLLLTIGLCFKEVCAAHLEESFYATPFDVTSGLPTELCPKIKVGHL